MTRTVDDRILYAGTNEFYKCGHKAQEKIIEAMQPSESGFYNIKMSNKYFAFGTSEGKYGMFAKWREVCFSVNKAGYIWAKAGTEKGDAFVQMLEELLKEMRAANAARISAKDDDEDDE